VNRPVASAGTSPMAIPQPANCAISLTTMYTASRGVAPSASNDYGEGRSKVWCESRPRSRSIADGRLARNKSFRTTR
jgi:hypothetical protein